MDVAFLTVFLGLVTGTKNVAVSVGPGVAAVELRLDGTSVGSRNAPPWTFVVDFGRELLPHDLAAVAINAEGSEIGMVRQPVNLYRPLAEASIVLETNPAGRRAARLLWTCAFKAQPRSIHVTWDGERLDIENPALFELPPANRSDMHVLRAELRFGRSVTAVVEAFIGGNERDFTSADLTSFPVVLSGKEPLPGLEELSGWFVRGGRPLPAVAVEEGPAEVLFVVDPRAELPLYELSRRSGQAGWGEPPLLQAERAKFSFRLAKDISFRFAMPALERFEETGYEVFTTVGPYTRSDGGVLWTLDLSLRNLLPRDSNRLRNVAALAGTVAAYGRLRRAVVWILADETSVANDDWQLARRYLGALRVPLFVWRISRKAASAPVANGEVDVSTEKGLKAAIAQLEKALARQRIVWVEGRHLPQSISLSPAAKGLELVR